MTIAEDCPNPPMDIEFSSVNFCSEPEFQPVTNTVSVESLSNATKRSPVCISWKNLKYDIKKTFRKEHVEIIGGVSGCVNAGKLTAVMGSSGAGKTTLLNILSGYFRKNVEGTISVNGRPRIMSKFRKISCYIMELDNLIEGLTVDESMTIAADLKISENVSKTEKTKIIDEVLGNLGLNNARSTRIKFLSGGEKKRLSIAVELVSNPSVVFLDEPTSGLDSSICYRFIQLLKSLAKGGRTIICSIHQPSSRVFSLFDDLYMLSNGKCVYKGEADKIISFLSSQGLHCPTYFNPADFITDAASCGYLPPLANNIENDENESVVFCKENGIVENGVINGGFSAEPEFVKEITESKECPVASLNQTIEEPARYPTGYLNQFLMLSKRTFLSDIRHPNFLIVRFLSTLLFGIGIGLIFFNIGNNAKYSANNGRVLFFHILFVMLTGLLPTLIAVSKEMSVFRREHFNGWYSILMYYLSRTMVEIVFQMIFPTIYASVVYWMTGQPNESWRYGYFVFLVILTSMVAQSFCLIFSICLPLSISVFLAPLSVIPVTFFSGSFTRRDMIPSYLHWLFDISFVKYSLEGIILSIYGYDRAHMHCPEDEFCILKDPKAILQEVDVERTTISMDVVGLLSMIVFFKVLAFILTKWKMREK